MLEFDDIPSQAATSTPSTNDPASSILSIVKHGSAANAFGLRLFHGSAVYVFAMYVLLYTSARGRRT